MSDRGKTRVVTVDDVNRFGNQVLATYFATDSPVPTTIIRDPSGESLMVIDTRKLGPRERPWFFG